MKRNPGLVHLLRFLERSPKGAQAHLARRMQMHRSSLNKICRGLARPTLDQAFAIQRLTGVPADLWVEDIVREDPLQTMLSAGTPTNDIVPDGGGSIRA